MGFFLRETASVIGDDDIWVKVDQMLDWSRFEPILKRGLGRSGQRPQGYSPMVRFKCFLRDQGHNLSDPKLEYALKRRIDFMVFCGLQPHSGIPDETPHCRFRSALINAKVLDALLVEVNHQLAALG